ncbi:achaete-scute homolog 2-like [Narcine bancroftii]|uniref:achaete-scute homolog 2-like n=1 Tax=Narcine bancroftii TaxID=1343680 RepID=UPI003832219E
MEHLRSTLMLEVGAQGSGKGKVEARGRRAHRQDPLCAPDANLRRNERERNRVRLVNLGFSNLQQHVPQSGTSKRMSKVDTLRSAVNYIRGLECLLREQGRREHPDYTGPAVERQSTSGSPSCSCSSEDTSRDSIYSEQEFAAYKEWLGIE